MYPLMLQILMAGNRLIKATQLQILDIFDEKIGLRWEMLQPREKNDETQHCPQLLKSNGVWQAEFQSFGDW